MVVKRITLTNQEKQALWKTLAFPWDESQLTLANYVNIQEKIGLTPVLTEVMFFHLVNLKDLERFNEWIIFKGGTAVQSYVPPTYQRASFDLDFNSTVGHPDVILDRFHQLNERLIQEDRIVVIDDVPFGKFVFDYMDEHSGTITFFRLLPTRFNLHVSWQQKKIQGRKYRVQINYKHSEFPARRYEKITNPTLLPLHFCTPKEPIIANAASVGDLIADKLLTLTKVGGFGRERLKDAYDLILLCQFHPNDLKPALDKLQAIARLIGVSREELVRSSLETLTTISEWHHEAQGFHPQVATDGRNEILHHWTRRVLKARDFIASFIATNK